MMSQFLHSRHLGTSHSSPSCYQLPHCIFLNLIDSLKSLPFQVILVLGKAKVTGCQIGALGGLNHLGDLMFHQKWMRCEAWAGMLSWWSCQSPAAHTWGFLSHPNHFHRGMFKLNAKFDADWLLHSLSYFECDGHTVHTLTQWCLLPHWLIQWSCHCSHMHIPVHTPGCQVISISCKLFLLY